MAENDSSKSPSSSSELNSSESKDSNGSQSETNNTNGAHQTTPRCFLRPSALQAQASRFSSTGKPFGNSPFGFTNSFGNGLLTPGKSSDATTNGNDSRPNPFARTPIAPDESQQDMQSFEPLSRNENAEFANTTPVRVHSSASVSNSNFVFGQNMLSRVANASPTASNQNQENGDKPSDLSFSPTTVSSTAGDNSGKSLEESAQEYEQRQVKRTYDEVQVVTGEEDESNVLQIASKLHMFDKGTSTWTERGRGFLRLNDKKMGTSVQSRIIMRTQGSLRVILNFQVWTGMTIEKPSDKTIRFTAVEPEGIKVYLVTAHQKDIEQLQHAVEWRLTSLRKVGQQSGQSATVKKAKLELNPESQNETCNSKDDSDDPQDKVETTDV